MADAPAGGQFSVSSPLISIDEPYEIPNGRHSQPAVDSEGRPLTDEDLLIACSAERRQSAGFEEDATLLTERERALNYSKGEMPDLPYLANRSQAVSMDVADAIETALPDLIEIFTGGDDVLTFKPNGPQDEKQAEQETDYVKQVLFNENDGYGLLFDIFKDALQVKVGIATAWWEDRPPQVEDFEDKSDEELVLAAMSSEISNLVEGEPAEDGSRRWSFTATRKQRGRLKIASIPPEDFTVARDAVKLREATYCAWRARPRAQKLIKDGIPRDVVDRLPAYGTTYDETLRLARDTAGEFADQRSVTGLHDMRQVEVITHFIEIDADGTGPNLWKIVTGNAETILISKEKIKRLDVAAITPYRVPHRFYGESLADKVLELQRQRTALKRIMLDSAYFSLNQRVEVAENKMSEWTMGDLLRIEPGMPVRSKTGDAVRPIEAGSLNFNVLEALEFSAVEVEQRTGIVRSAQGLSPDTLHETAHGMLALLAAAQKRLRMMAQLFAEMGLRDFYQIVHAILREHDDVNRLVKFRGEWVPVSPTDWDEREAMIIEVGQGSAGQAAEVASLNELALLQEKIIQAQMQMPNVPPVVTAQNVYNLASRIAEKSGEKRPDAYFTDPSRQPQLPPGSTPPHPEAIKAQSAERQAMIQAQQQEADRQQQGQIEANKLAAQQQQAQAASQLDQQRVNAEAQERQARLDLERQKAQADDVFRHTQLQAEMARSNREMDLKAQLAREGIMGSFAQAVTIQHMKDRNDDAERENRLEIQASQAEDAARLADKGE